MVSSLPLLSCESSVSMSENPDRKKKKILEYLGGVIELFISWRLMVRNERLLNNWATEAHYLIKVLYISDGCCAEFSIHVILFLYKNAYWKWNSFEKQFSCNLRQNVSWQLCSAKENLLTCIAVWFELLKELNQFWGTFTG